MEQSGQAGHASIEFSTKAYFKTISYLTFCDKEVGWYGLIERGKKDNEFFVSDIFLYPQFVTAASVRSPQKEFAKWQDGFSAEDFKKLRFFCHSHANMVPTPSGYDLEVQQEITSQLHDDQFFVFMIMNKSMIFGQKSATANTIVSMRMPILKSFFRMFPVCMRRISNKKSRTT